MILILILSIMAESNIIHIEKEADKIFSNNLIQNTFIQFLNTHRSQKCKKIQIGNIDVGDGHGHFVESTSLQTSYCSCSGDDADRQGQMMVLQQLQPQSQWTRPARTKLQNNVVSENCFETMKFAKLIGNQSLLQKTQEYLIQNFELILNENPDKFEKLDLEEVVSILGHDKLSVTCEEFVWEAALRWIKYNENYRKYKVNELLTKVRTGLLDTHYFIKNVKQNEFVRDNESCLQFIKTTEEFFKDVKISADLNCTPSIASARSGRIRNEVLFTFGGISEDENIDDSLIIEFFDKKTSRWRKYDVLEEQRAYHGTIVQGYEVSIIGGCCCDAEVGLDYLNSCRLFNALHKTWRDLAPMNSHRGFLSAVLLDGRSIYAIGGVGKSRHVINTVERYDATSDCWITISPMQVKRAQACATDLKGKLYVMGGWNECEWLDSVEIYDPDTNQWTQICSMQQVRAGASCVTYHNCIYVIGGYNGDEVAKSGEKYDLNCREWIRTPPMLDALSEFSATVFDGNIVCVGGEKCENNVYSLTNDVQCFDTNTNQWCKMTRMGIPRHALSSCVVEFPRLDFCTS